MDGTNPKCPQGHKSNWWPRLRWRLESRFWDLRGWLRSWLPMPRFEIKDRAGWHRCVANNRDGYGGAAVHYAAAWAHLMEERMASGATLAEVAKVASHDADTDGITGFMYGAAVSMLSQVWVHGEELRRWHNLDCQIHDEGERANESGAVLNPALMTLHPK